MRTMNKAVVVSLVAGLAFSAGSRAETDTWQFEVTPYLLAAGMDGTVGIRGHEADIDVSFSDIWDDLDAGFMGLFTAKKEVVRLKSCSFQAVYITKN